MPSHLAQQGRPSPGRGTQLGRSPRLRAQGHDGIAQQAGRGVAGLRQQAHELPGKASPSRSNTLKPCKRTSAACCALASAEVARPLEALLVVAGVPATPFTPSTPDRLRHARTCHDHMAGTVAVTVHEQLHAQGWLLDDGGEGEYCLSEAGAAGMTALGIVVPQLQRQRRRFACACLDWSERRAHLGGALGATLLQLALRRRWAERELDSRALRLTPDGERRLLAALGGF
eukprot:gene15115-17890_t